MRKILFLCGMVVCAAFACGSALAATTASDSDMGEAPHVDAVTKFIAVLQNTWGGASHVTDIARPRPYDKQVLVAATAERDRRVAICKSRKVKSEAARVACLVSAARGFAKTMKFADNDIVNAYAAALAAVAGDVHSGKLTADQAHTVYDLLATLYQSLLGRQFDAYDAELEAHILAGYKDNFARTYQQDSAAVSATPDQPPFDDRAEGAAHEILDNASGLCSAGVDEKKIYADCILAAEKNYADAVKLRDTALYNAYATTLQAAVADAEAGRLTPSQFDSVAEMMNHTYRRGIDQQLSDYHEISARPLAQGYVVRFLAEFNSANPFYREDMPFDQAAMDKAMQDQFEGNSECQHQNKGMTTEVAALECFVAVYRSFAQAIKLRDMDLFDDYIAALRQAAADTDAGRLSKWQEGIVYEALARTYGGMFSYEYGVYIATKYQSLVTQYVTKFDNDYIAGGGGEDAGAVPPWDEAAAPAAIKTHDQAMESCFEQRDALKTNVAFFDCRAAAEKNLAAAIHRHDLLLLETMLAANRQAAADADAGKITFDQLDGITSALGQAYSELCDDAWVAWRRRQEEAGSGR